MRHSVSQFQNDSNQVISKPQFVIIASIGKKICRSKIVGTDLLFLATKGHFLCNKTVKIRLVFKGNLNIMLRFDTNSLKNCCIMFQVPN